jgi:2-polyprenyl-6-methoxyphenol hydroxylase-like FAD-dependent oxidoreductase
LAAERDATVLIIGGGVAGLTAAIALDRYGIDSLVFEQVDDVRKSQLGAGLSLGINVARAFKHLELLEQLTEVGAPIEERQFLTDKGKDLGTSPISPDAELVLGVLRPRFHQFLVEAVGAEKLRVGSKFVRFEQDEDGVTAHFADGGTARGEVLIGADGIKSTLRAQLLGPAEPRYSGYVTRRGVLETDHAKNGLERIIFGSAKRFLYYPVGRWWVYWTAATNEPPGGQQSGAEIKQTVLERFAGWPEPVESLVAATEESSTFLADTFDRDPVDRWGEGRVTLLGDAAHPMTWDRGQGAGQGIEGAVLLARELAKGDDPAAALRAWEAERIPRTAKIVNDSRRVGKLGQTENPLPRMMHRVGARITTRRFRAGKGSEGLKVEF